MDKATKILKDKYGLNFGSYKYVLPGAEILKYIGQNVMCVHYVLGEDGNWTHKYTPAAIKTINKFDPMNMTYECTYQIEGEEEEKSMRIVPEGYSWGNPEETKEMYRFVPFSIHAQMLEDDNFFTRIEELYNTRETLPLSALETIARSKEKDGILKYTHNLGACVKLKEEEHDFLWIRLHNINLAHKKGETWSLKISDNDRSWNMLINSDEKEYDFNGFGTFKIIDLADPGEVEVEEVIKNMEKMIEEGSKRKAAEATEANLQEGESTIIQ